MAGPCRPSSFRTLLKGGKRILLSLSPPPRPVTSKERNEELRTKPLIRGKAYSVLFYPPFPFFFFFFFPWEVLVQLGRYRTKTLFSLPQPFVLLQNMIGVDEPPDCCKEMAPVPSFPFPSACFRALFFFVPGVSGRLPPATLQLEKASSLPPFFSSSCC